MEKNSFRENMGEFLDRAAGFLGRNFGFIFCFWILNGLTQVIMLANNNTGDAVWGYGFYILLVAMLAALASEKLFVSKAGKVFRYLLCVLSFVPFVIEGAVLYQYNALIGVGVVASLLETNPAESIEFLNTSVGPLELLYASEIVLAAILLARFKPWRKVLVLDDSRRVLMGMLLSLTIGYVIHMLIWFPGLMLEDPLTPGTRMIMSSSNAIKNIQAYHELADEVDVNIELTRNDGRITNIVFILGEATNRNHMHLYGYDIPNTPNLDDMADRGEICVFRDVVSPHSTTIASLSKIFTFCNYEAELPWYKYHNFIDIMNSAGYKTHWLSNQESSGIWGNLAQLLADHSKVHQFTQIRDSREDNGVVDGELFPLVDKAIYERADDRNFYVVHLMGGHVAYYNRYPYMFTKFSKDDITVGQTIDQKKIIAQYDNALYYNDYIVSGIIDKFRETKTDTILVYLPDHGEAVYDDDGIQGHIEENPSRHMIEIPMIIWASDVFKEKHPEKWAAIQRAVNRPYMTDDMIHTLMDIADVRTEEWEASRSLINDEFNSSRARIFDDKDYDLEIRNK